MAVNMSKNLVNLAKALYGIPLFLTGVVYLLRPQEAVESLTSFIPGGLSLIYIAGVLWLLLGVLITLGIKTYYAAWGVVFTLLAYQVLVHVPALYTGDYMTIVLFELLRDISLLGGAFFIIAIARFEEEEPKDLGLLNNDREITLF